MVIPLLKRLNCGCDRRHRTTLGQRKEKCWTPREPTPQVKCLGDRFLVFSEKHLDYVVRKYFENYHTERPRSDD
jgi:hypothetical protein